MSAPNSLKLICARLGLPGWIYAMLNLCKRSDIQISANYYG